MHIIRILQHNSSISPIHFFCNTLIIHFKYMF
jgi:hypothetical protein